MSRRVLYIFKNERQYRASEYTASENEREKKKVGRNYNNSPIIVTALYIRVFSYIGTYYKSIVNI